MEFNKVVRGANRSIDDIGTIYEILDAGFLCHVGFHHEGQTMMIPTAYGRKGDWIYLHGSAKNFMLQQITNGQTCCIAVTHLDGIVMARTLFDSSVNYRSAVLFGKAEVVSDPIEKLDGLKIITDNTMKGRWEEVPVGTENQLKATLVVKCKIDRISAKVRDGGPAGDENCTNDVWSGHIPMVVKVLDPVPDAKFNTSLEHPDSVRNFLKRF